MNPYIKLSLLVVVNLLCFKLAGLWFGLIATCIVIYKILSMLGILRNISFYRGPFYEGVIFTKDYLGPYTQQEEAYKDAFKLIELFKLEDFVLIAIFFDSPEKVEENKLRSSIGIYKKNIGFADKLPEEFERYCEKNGYNKAELPNSTSIYSSWEFFNNYSLKMGITKFYQHLKKNLNDANFKRTYNFNESKLKATVELYNKEFNKIEFFVPILNGDKFLVFKKDK